MNYHALFAVCCMHFGIDRTASGAAVPEPVHRAAFALVPHGFSWPDLDGDGLRRLQNDIERLRCSIEGLDRRSMPHVRQATQDHRDYMAKLMAGEDVKPFPREQWIDSRALAMLDELRDAVAVVATRHANEIAWRPNGSGGRRPARAPYMVALVAARLYRDMTPSAPAFWTNGETPYSRLLGDLFEALGIKADTRRPAEWAIRQIARETRISA